MTKNNKALRAALVLCVLALFCAAFVGATFAKYVTADDASDTARAAKWGIAVSIGGKLFGQHYEKTSTTSETADMVAVSSTNVAANNASGLAANIVAPGTKSHKGIIIDLKGTPEVEYLVTANGTADDIYLGVGTWAVMVPAQEVTEDNFATYIADAENDYDKLYKKDGAKYVVANAWEADTDYFELHDLCVITADTDDSTEDKYYPLTWTVANTGEDSAVVTGGKNLVVVTANLVNAINGVTDVANETLAANYKLTWEWAFDGVNDPADTILGNLMQEDAANCDVVILDGADFVQPAVDINYNLDLAFDINVQVEQVN